MTLDEMPTAEDLARARAVLARRQQDNERILSELEAAHLATFSEESAWLRARWSAEQQVAWDRRWGALRVPTPAPAAVREPARLQPTKPCARCGIPRVVNESTKRVSVLCKDCRYVMPKEEIALWAA